MKKIIFASIPSEQGSLGKNRGCSLAPKKLTKQLAKKPWQNFELVEIPVIENNIEATDESIFENAKKIIKRKNCFPIFLGGDHSVSYSVFRAFALSHENPALVVFDAHPDCVQFFKPLSHEDWISGVVEENLVKKENVLLLGVRKIHKLEQQYLKKKKIQVIKASAIKKNLKKSANELEMFLKKHESVYLSVDIDVFDPKLCPGTGYLEKHGLNEKQFFALFEKILESKKLKALDLAEANPLKDKNGKTLKLSGKILKTAIKSIEPAKPPDARQFSIYAALLFLWNFLKQLEKSMAKEFIGKKPKKNKKRLK